MPSVAHAATVLAAPRRAAEALRVSSEQRLDDLAAAEQRIRARERDVELREHVLRRAIDAGASRGSDARLHRWVVDELLPKLPPPEASVSITAEMGNAQRSWTSTCSPWRSVSYSSAKSRKS